MVLDSAWISIALFLIPLYVANSMAMVFGGGNPLDGNRLMRDGKPILGKGKTVRGTIAGIACGTIAAAMVWLLFPQQTLIATNQYVLFGFLVSCGAMAGDLAGSFIKRRLLIDSGAPTPGLDQLGFAVGGLLFSTPLYLPNAYEVLVICAFTIITHVGSNYAAFKMGIKKVPW